MKLHELVKGLELARVTGGLDVEISGLAYDSRQVREGFLFAALAGGTADGHDYLADAAGRGAAAVLVQRAGAAGPGITELVAADTRRALAEIACRYHGDPSASLRVVGSTGTNGKTTVSCLVRDVLASAGLSPGSIGTVSYQIGARVIPAVRTTPEAPDLQSMLAQMLRAGCKSAVMEVSSHALVQDRVWGTRFDVGIFTNLTRDHLDYHETMERYFEAKKRFFQSAYFRDSDAAAVVVNSDDPWGRQLLAQGAAPFLDADRVITFGTRPEAAVRAEDIELSSRGSSFLIRSPWETVRVKLRLLGRYNIYNALAAFSACAALGVDIALIAHVLSSVVFVRGRLEEIDTRRGFQVFIDYAHTDDAMQNVLTTLREITAGRLIVVFGCGGNRDRSKRPAMGRVAARLADYTFLTSDNPRNEDPAEIIEAIEVGFRDADNYEIVEDRREAIGKALAMAQRGDIVLVAGKGHENYQELANRVVPFDDRQVVRQLLGAGRTTR